MLRKAAQVLVGSYGPRPGEMFFWSDLLGALSFLALAFVLPAALLVVSAGAPAWLLVGVVALVLALVVSWVVAMVRRV